MQTIVHSDALDSVAVKLDGYADNFNTTLSKVKSTNQSLSNVWTGEDATKYIGAVDEQAKVMDNLYQALTEMSKFMKEVSTTYKNVSDTNMSGIR